MRVEVSFEKLAMRPMRKHREVSSWPVRKLTEAIQILAPKEMFG